MKIFGTVTKGETKINLVDEGDGLKWQSDTPLDALSAEVIVPLDQIGPECGWRPSYALQSLASILGGSHSINGDLAATESIPGITY